MMLRTVVFCLLGIGLSFGQEPIRSEGANGTNIVDAVVNRIRDSCVFPDFKLFLRRLAYVQTTDGQNPDTYRSGYDGGIWKVDRAMFDMAKRNSNATALYDAINLNFAIDWNTVTWHDLRKPLYSGLAAALFLVSLSEEIPRNTENQAPYYKSHFRDDSQAANDYFTKIKQMQSVCQQANLDLVFVVDGSSSLSPSDFKNAKSFAHDVVKNFDMKFVHVAFVTFSVGYKSQFVFNTYSNSTSLLDAIDHIQKPEGQTDADKALEFVAHDLFTSSYGARRGSSKVVLLLTDGESTHPASTINAAAQAKSNGIVIFAIGIGSGIKTDELNHVATKPLCTHVIQLAGYQDLAELVSQIQHISCKVAAVLVPGTYTFPCSQVGLFQFLANGTDTQVTITLTDGLMKMYGSLTDPTPNEAVYSFRSVVFPSQESAILMTKQVNPVYIQTKPEHCSGTYTIKVGPPERVQTETELNCVEHDIPRPCSVVNIYGRIYHLLSPPYSMMNICPVLKTPAWYPEGQGQVKYVFCDRNNTMYVFTCDPHHIYDIQSKMCISGEPTTTRSTTSTTTTTAAAATTTATAFTMPVRTGGPVGGNPCSKANVAAGNFFFPYPPDETKYIDCTNWPTYGYIKNCSKGKVWDQRDLTCTYKFVVINGSSLNFSNIPNPCINPLRDGDLFYYPHPTDNTMYIQCDQYGDGFLKTCPKNRIWNESLLICVPTNLLVGTNKP